MHESPRATPTPPTVPPAAIRLEGLRKSYHGQLVVRDLDLSVAASEFVSLVGPSGCGKTTVLRLIAGFEQPDAGQVTIGGRRMEGVPTFLRNTAIVVQGFALFRNLNVLQNVEFGLEMRRLPRQERTARARAMIDLVGLNGLERRRVDQLSGGQRQRVALARALVVEPDVLLLDEPLGALDANLRVRMQGELKRLQRSLGITFVHVTGNQGEAMAMADRMVVMERGRIVQQGPPREVFRAPTTRFVARFMGNNNVVDGRLTEVDSGRAIGTVVGPLGAFRAPVNGTAAGTTGALIVRTDRVRFVEPKASGEENVVPGVIAGEEFAGSTITYFVQVATGELLRVERHQSIHRGAEHRIGDRVTLGWPVGSTVFVADDADRGQDEQR